MAEQPKQNVKISVDESKMTTTYANGFRHHVNQHEIMLDLGVSVAVQGNKPDERQMSFQVDNRLVMNYVTAKRLAGLMVQVIQAHEKQFGEIKADLQQG